MFLRRKIHFAVLAFCLAGCAGIQEPFKLIWGSSTRALDKARDEALKGEFNATPRAAFDAVVDFVKRETRKQEELDAQKRADLINAGKPLIDRDEETNLIQLKSMQIFIQDRKKMMLVLMGIPGSNDTTEVGIYFTPTNDGYVQVEVVSLSRRAKTKAAEIIFAQLKRTFPDPATTLTVSQTNSRVPDKATP